MVFIKSLNFKIMKKLLRIFVALLFISVAFTPKIQAQDTNNVLLELCTGTWCQWCPCGHTIADQILTTFPNTLILEYHGPANTASDPFSTFNGNSILSNLGLSAYPQGVIGRRTGPISRSAWAGQASYQSTFAPDVRIDLIRSYNPATRLLVLTANVTALRTLDTTVNINFVMLEDKLIYPQTGNSSCTGGTNYIHNHVVRNMVNGATGEQLSTGTWTGGTVKSVTWNYTVPSGWEASNCEIGVFAYFVSGTLSSNSYVLNTRKASLEIPTGIGNENETTFNYTLEQNYPNPFNPVTNIKFSIPKNGQTAMKIYDILGNEVMTYFNQFLEAGNYNIHFDASNLSSGIYYYKLISKDFSQTKKMMLIK